jgi:hypothetical protein
MAAHAASVTNGLKNSAMTPIAINAPPPCDVLSLSLAFNQSIIVSLIKSLTDNGPIHYLPNVVKVFGFICLIVQCPSMFPPIN